jgi:putative ABC transport system permease protein
MNLVGVSMAFGQNTDLILRPTVTIGQVAVVAGLVMALAVLGSLQPAYRASRLDPIEALRHV